MRSAVKVTLRTIGVLVLLLAIPIAYLTVRGYTAWWFPSSGSVSVDEIKNGYLHTNWQNTAAVITRTDLKPNQSYLVVFDTSKTSKSVTSCGDWHAPHYLIFPIGDVNPPCLGLVLDDLERQQSDLPLSSTLSIQTNRIEFSTIRGKKISASW